LIPQIDLYAQYLTIKQEIDDALATVIESGQFILGKQGQEFEKEVASYIGTKYAVGVGNGTDALYLSLQALGIKAKDGVVVPTFTFIATAECAVRCGATPIFIDSERSGNINIADLESYLAKNHRYVKAIIPVHLYGNPVDMDKLMGLAGKYGLYVVEDCAQAWGATWKGQRVGSFGDTGCFSCFPTKTLGAAGDAGIVTTNNKDIADMIIKLRNHGIYKHAFYDEHGVNSRLDEIQAAILRVKLRHLDDWIDIRRSKAHLYNELLKPLEIAGVYTPAETEGHGWNYYTFITPDRDELKAYLADQGIQAPIYFPQSLHRQKVYEYLDYKEGSLPRAEFLEKNVLSLPLYPELSDIDIQFICKAIKVYFRAQGVQVD
jgi:dTDP-4-amino-4,6-dideoxygalactose transaminase